MLNKNVCKNCINRHCNNSEGIWNERRESSWDQESTVFCPTVMYSVVYVMGGNDVKSEPPLFCPYRLEHFVCRLKGENDEPATD